MIRLEDVSAGYGKKKVLSSVSADLRRGKLTVIIGPNGSGKSTLLKCISGIIPIMSGRVMIDGRELAELKRQDVAKMIAYLSQGRELPNMTVSQLVLHGRFPHLSFPRRYSDNDREKASQAIEAMGMKGLEDKAINGLSGGMRQSAYIAMALCQETDCILFDEPSTYLDISHTLSLMRRMKALAENGRAVVAVMHDITMALDFADEVIVMDKGNIIIQESSQNVVRMGIIQDVFGVGIKKNDSKYEYDY